MYIEGYLLSKIIYRANRAPPQVKVGQAMQRLQNLFPKFRTIQVTPKEMTNYLKEKSQMKIVVL
jgi:hypothetical protein